MKTYWTVADVTKFENEIIGVSMASIVLYILFLENKIFYQFILSYNSQIGYVIFNVNCIVYDSFIEYPRSITKNKRNWKN